MAVRFFEPFLDALDAFLRPGTLAPARRASDNPIAMACLRLVTFLPERPERSLPLFISSILRCTFLLAFFPYRREPFFFLVELFFLVAMHKESAIDVPEQRSRKRAKERLHAR